MNVKTYILNFLIGFDQFVNTIMAGHPDETISSRAWRCKDSSKFWGFMRKLIDWLFFFQKEHCYNAYIEEVERRQVDINIPNSKEK